MRKRVFPFTRLTFSVEPMKWKEQTSTSFFFKEFTRTKQGNIRRSKHDLFSRFVRLSARSSPQQTRKFKSPVRARGDTGERAGYGEIQGHLQRLSKPGHPDEKLHAGGILTNIWSFHGQKQVPQRNSSSFRPRWQSRLTLCDLIQHRDRLCA